MSRLQQGGACVGVAALAGHRPVVDAS